MADRLFVGALLLITSSLTYMIGYASGNTQGVRETLQYNPACNQAPPVIDCNKEGCEYVK